MPLEDVAPSIDESKQLEADWPETDLRILKVGVGLEGERVEASSCHALALALAMVERAVAEQVL